MFIWKKSPACIRAHFLCWGSPPSLIFSVSALLPDPFSESHSLAQRGPWAASHQALPLSPVQPPWPPGLHRSPGMHFHDPKCSFPSNTPAAPQVTGMCSLSQLPVLAPSTAGKHRLGSLCLARDLHFSLLYPHMAAPCISYSLGSGELKPELQRGPW